MGPYQVCVVILKDMVSQDHVNAVTLKLHVYFNPKWMCCFRDVLASGTLEPNSDPLLDVLSSRSVARTMGRTAECNVAENR